MSHKPRIGIKRQELPASDIRLTLVVRHLKILVMTASLLDEVAPSW